MINYTLQALGLVFAGVIFWRAESILNLMSQNCLFAVRASFWLIVVGAISTILAISQGYVPLPKELTTLAGLAVLLVVERRISSLLRVQHPITHERRTQ